MLTTLGELEEGDRFILHMSPDFGVCICEGKSLATGTSCYFRTEAGAFRIGSNKLVVDKIE